MTVRVRLPQFMLYWGRHQLQGSCNSRSTIFLNFRRRFPTFEQVVRAALHRIFTIFPVVQVHLLEGNIGIFLASLNQGAFTRYLLLESLSLELIFPFFSSLLLYLDLHWPFCETMYNFKFPTLTPLQPPFCLFLRAVTEFLRFPCACRLAWNWKVQFEGKNSSRIQHFEFREDSLFFTWSALSFKTVKWNVRELMREMFLRHGRQRKF